MTDLAPQLDEATGDGAGETKSSDGLVDSAVDEVPIKAADAPPADAPDESRPSLSSSLLGEPSMAESQEPFTFRRVADFGLSFLESSEGKEYWKKWGLAPYVQAFRFEFAERFEDDAEGHLRSKRAAEAVEAGAALGGIELADANEETSGKAADFLLSLMRSPALHAALRVPSASSAAPAGGSGSGATAAAAAGSGLSGLPGGVRFERLRCTQTSLSFLDRLQDEGLVYQDGTVARCLPQQAGGVEVQDRLRACLADEEGEDWGLFGEEERRELLLHLLTDVAVGGGMCQWEDNWEPYLQAARALYKDMVSVTRAADTGDIKVVTRAYLLKGLLGESAPAVVAEAAGGGAGAGAGGETGASAGADEATGDDKGGKSDGKESDGAATTKQKKKRRRRRRDRKPAGPPPGPALFPGDSPHNRMVVTVDPKKRIATVYYSPFTSWW